MKIRDILSESQQVFKGSQIAELVRPSSGLSYREILQMMGDDAHADYVLVDYPVKYIYTTSDQLIDDKKVNDFSARITTNPPPVLLDRYSSILDGHHRWLSAKKRGSPTVRAYIPKSLFDELKLSHKL
jgi:hypothetical protein